MQTKIESTSTSASRIGRMLEQGMHDQRRSGGPSGYNASPVLGNAERTLRHARDQLVREQDLWITLTAAAKVMRRSAATVERLALSHRIGSYIDDKGNWRISRAHARELAATKR